nr:MAG TPA: hypothetical protein [Caudoviricetes sp.]
MNDKIQKLIKKTSKRMPERRCRFIFGCYRFRRKIGNISSWKRYDGSHCSI